MLYANEYYCCSGWYRYRFVTCIGSKHAVVLFPPSANDLANALLRDVEGSGQVYDRFALLVARADLLIAVMPSRRMVGEGYRRRSLAEIHEQRTVIDRVHKMLECPASRAPPPPVLALRMLEQTEN